MFRFCGLNLYELVGMMHRTNVWLRMELVMPFQLKLPSLSTKVSDNDLLNTFLHYTGLLTSNQRHGIVIVTRVAKFCCNA